MWRVLKKLDMDLSYDLNKPFLATFPKDSISYHTAVLSRIARKCRQPICPSTAEWIVKIWIIHKMEFYSAPKIKRNVQVNGWKLKLQ